MDKVWIVEVRRSMGFPGLIYNDRTVFFDQLDSERFFQELRQTHGPKVVHYYLDIHESQKGLVSLHPRRDR